MLFYHRCAQARHRLKRDVVEGKRYQRGLLGVGIHGSAVLGIAAPFGVGKLRNDAAIKAFAVW